MTNFPEQIQKRIDAGMGCGSGIGDGWMRIVVELDEQIAAIDPDYKIDQIKEKFGGLRYYITLSENINDHTRNEIYKLIALAENRASDTCDVCGAPGKQVCPRGWLLTRCEEHSK